MVTVDGTEAAASVAYRLSDVIAIYPITPSSPMGELSDEWAVQGRRNVWGLVPSVSEHRSSASPGQEPPTETVHHTTARLRLGDT